MRYVRYFERNLYYTIKSSTLQVLYLYHRFTPSLHRHVYITYFTVIYLIFPFLQIK